ncbi:hypothetical protein [Nocardia sp. NBC_01388]|uniref:hypothetical protein n=1 Tax=Nocardia sp. NBC_01388 TaxID=2903596 RepID=UPI003246727D
MTLNIGDRIRFDHHDRIHGVFEVEGEIVYPIYDDNGELERVWVAVGHRTASIEPCQILDR